MTFAVRFVGSQADIPDALWEACFPPPLEGRWWYETLEASDLEDQFAFRYGLILEDGREVGIAPLFLMNVPLSISLPPALRPLVQRLERALPAVFAPRTLFVGSPCSDEGTVGLLAGVERRAALETLQGALEAEARRHRAPMIVWKDLPSSYDGDMAGLVAARRLFRLVSFPNAVVDLPSARKADYLASLKSSRRNKLRKKLRISAASVELDTKVVTEPDPALLDALVALFMHTYDKADTKFERLNRRFFEAVARKVPSRFIVLRERGVGAPVAFMLCFVLPDRIINKFIGIDYGRPKDWFLYFRLWDAVVDLALAEHASSIQSGQTAYSAKIEVGHRIVPLTNYGRHRLGPVQMLLRAIAARISWSTLDDDLATWLKAHPERAADQHGSPRDVVPRPPA